MQEIIKKFHELEDLLFLHQHEDDMKVYKCAMKELLAYTAQRDPVMANKIIEKLQAIQWEQYLSHEEAHKVYNSLQPQAKWDYNTLQQHLKNLNLSHEEEGQYNSYALWICISGIYSDHSNTFAKMMGKTHVNEIPDHELIPHLHVIAIEKLKDKDGYYEIREYFDV
jgi:hypothetical protein